MLKVTYEDIKPVSFVIYFCAERIENLLQTLRFLRKREPNLVRISEIVLVCQDKTNCIDTGFKRTIHLNLDLDFYWKPHMNNCGVRLCSNDLIVLLDSDRILPQGYFTRYSNSLFPGEFLTTTTMYKAQNILSDKEIEDDHYFFDYDDKSEQNDMHMKNAFSGNTILYRQDYWDAGGMDENYKGYGYCDNDFTRLMLSKNKKPVYVNDAELHLFHGRPNPDKYRDQNIKNGLFYCKKWGLEPSGNFKKILENNSSSL